jgi:chromosome segregation ATPase
MTRELEELEARIRNLKEEADQTGLLLRLENLVLRLRKEMDLQSWIRILEEELGDLVAELPGAPPEREGPIRAAISRVEDLLAKYRSLQGA